MTNHNVKKCWRHYIRPVIIPRHTPVDVDIIKRNMRTAQMAREEYFKLLSEY